MVNEKMNVHKALTELKVIDARINKAITQPAFVAIKKHSAENIRGMTVKQVTDGITSSYQSAVDLIIRRNAIKRAVVLSNARTRVIIAGKEYTIAEAIDMKNNGMDGYRKLRDTLRQQLQTCTRSAERDNEMLENKADAFIKDVYGNSDMSKVGEGAKKDRKEYIAAQTVELVDPLDVLRKIEELDELINSFMIEVDSALSVSNAVTEIEVQY